MFFHVHVFPCFFMFMFFHIFSCALSFLMSFHVLCMPFMSFLFFHVFLCLIATCPDTVALHCTYMFVLTCSFAVRSVCFRTSPANALLHISLEIRLEHSYHCVVFLSVHSSNSTLVLFCLVTLSKPSFPSITISLSGSSLQPAHVPRPQYRYSVIWCKIFEVLQQCLQH